MISLLFLALDSKYPSAEPIVKKSNRETI